MTSTTDRIIRVASILGVVFLSLAIVEKGRAVFWPQRMLVCDRGDEGRMKCEFLR